MAIGELQRAALFEIVELWSPFVDESRSDLAAVLDDDDDQGPEGVLVDSLRGYCLTYCDWKSDPPEIRSYLERLPLCPPELTWEWYDWNDQGRWDPDDLRKFLWPLADRCLTLGVAVVGVYVDGDGFTLGFIGVDKLDRLLKLAATAEAKIYVHRTGAPLP